MRWFIIIIVTILIKDAQTTFNFVIVHNNDMHSRFDEFDKSLNRRLVGGMARTAYKVKEFRQAANNKTGPPVIFLNAGDTFSGTVWFSIHRWKIVSEFLNILKPDAMCMGNHEFDDGITNLTNFLNATHVPMVCSNCNISLEPGLHDLIKPSTILQINGIKIGIIGYVDSTTKETTNCGNVTFTDEIEAVRAESRKLNSDGVGIILALGHSGFQIDQLIAREVEYIDIVIGGYSNTFQWNGEPPDLEFPKSTYPKGIYSYDGRRVPVLHAYAYTKYLGYLNVTFDEHGNLNHWNGNPIFMDTSIPKDNDTQELVTKYKKDVEEVMSVIVGDTVIGLNHINCRYEECNFGNLVADAFVSYKVENYHGPFWTDCAIGLVNAGSIKSSIHAGFVTMGHLLEATPYFQQIVSFDINGADLLAALELGVQAPTVESVTGEFLQVSGLKVIIDRRKPPGERVIAVEARCSRCLQAKFYSVEKELYYRVVTNQFVADGSNNRTFLRNNILNFQREDIRDVEAVRRYFEKTKSVQVGIERRLVILDEQIFGMLRNSNNTFEILDDDNCLGNHEFDDSVANLEKFVKSANFKITCSNVNFAQNFEFLRENILPSTILILEGVPIGIIGYITTSTKNVANTGETEFFDEVEHVRKEARKLRNAGVNIIIALGHAGYDMDKIIAKKVSEVDVVVGGHTNTFLWNGKQPDLEKPIDNYPKIVVQSSGKKVPVVQANCYTKYLGYLNLTFDDNGNLLRWSGQPIFMGNAIPKDTKVNSLVQEYKIKVEKVTKTIVGEAKYFLSKFECRFSECSLGNLLTDAFIEVAQHYRDPYPHWTNVAIAFANGGSIKTSIKEGNVTIGNIIDAFPYYQHLVIFDISGRDIIKALEIGSASDNIRDVDGEFLQTSGINAIIDKSRRIGDRVVSCEVRCQKCSKPFFRPIRANAYYKVVTNAFVANGGDGHLQFKFNGRNKLVLQVVDTEAVVRYFTKYKIIAHTIGDRIKVKHLRRSDRSASSGIQLRNLHSLYTALLILCTYIYSRTV